MYNLRIQAAQAAKDEERRAGEEGYRAFVAETKRRHLSDKLYACALFGFFLFLFLFFLSAYFIHEKLIL